MSPAHDSGRGELALLLDLIDEAYEKAAWHGPNLRGALRGVRAKGAAWRPAPGRHNIWELALHAAYWKYAVRRRLTGAGKGQFAVEGSNWFARPEKSRPNEKAWRADLAVLAGEHRRLRETVESFPTERLHVREAGSRHTNRRLIYGVAAHDLYHTGQIQILKRLGGGRA
ncbi:MAG: DinB family protein [Thermoanaerobaculia bacterium]